MSQVVVEEPRTQAKTGYITRDELANAMADLDLGGLAARDAGGATESAETGEGQGAVTKSGVEGSAGGGRTGRRRLPSGMSDDEEGWCHVGATSEDEDGGKTAWSAPRDFKAVTATMFERIANLVLGGDRLLDSIKEYLEHLNREVKLADDKTLQDQYSNVEYHLCEAALKRTVMREKSHRERLAVKEQTLLANAKSVTSCTKDLAYFLDER